MNSTAKPITRSRFTAFLLYSSLILSSSAWADPEFLAGGIGREEVESMRLVAKQYSLQLLFSQGKNGTALTEVDVNIVDAKGTSVFSQSQTGPLLYVNLPAGNYKVVGIYNGIKQTAKVSIVTGAKSQRVILNWVGNPADLIPEE